MLFLLVTHESFSVKESLIPQIFEVIKLTGDLLTREKITVTLLVVLKFSEKYKCKHTHTHIHDKLLPVSTHQIHSRP